MRVPLASYSLSQHAVAEDAGATDGRVLVTRFTDKDAATRYGNMVYVRCAARA